MSRSRRTTPIFGMTTARSDAEWKAKAARQLRHRARQIIVTTLDDIGLAGKCWDAVNPWSAPKDGKHWYGKAGPSEMRK